MGNANLDWLLEYDMRKQQKTNTPKPLKPKRVKLTNKAGATATPLEKDVDAWLAIGWVRAD